MTRPWAQHAAMAVLLVTMVANGLLVLEQRRRAKELTEMRQRVEADITTLTELQAELKKTVPPPSISPGEIPKNSTFHAPPGGCPKGTTPRLDLLEHDGVPVPACENPKGDGSLDYLMPGESMRLSIPLGKPEERKGTRI